MKSIKTFAVIIFSLFTINICDAQKNLAKEKIKVWGNCEMCKKKIEKAAKGAGATYANWNEDTQLLAVSYNSTETNALQIEKAVAASGYDTKDVKASDKAFKKLDACCQYHRKIN